MTKFKKVKQFDFMDIFKYAEEKYGVDWNTANDLFFNNVLQYRNVTTFWGGEDWSGYVSFYKTAKPALEYTVEEVNEMVDLDKAYLIVGAFLNENGVGKNEEVQVDAR